MITPIEMYSGHCDNCQKPWESYAGYMALTDASSVEEEMNDSGWFSGNSEDGHEGKNYCPTCWEFDEEDNLVLSESRKDKYKKS